MSKKNTISKPGTFLYFLNSYSELIRDIQIHLSKKYTLFYNKYIWRTRGNTPRRYKSAKELIDSLNNVAPYQKVHYRVHNILQHILETPRDVYRAIKRGLQRGYRGWSDEDTWCLSSYYARIIVPSLLHLKKIKHGIPSGVFEEADGIDKHGNPTELAIEKAEKRWDSYLDDMIYTFHVVELITNNDWHYTPTKSWSNA